MTNRQVSNVAASVHQRLLNKAKESNRPFNELLQHYAIERFIYRLSKTPLAEKFVLKGALMFAVWNASSFRPTKDIDLLGKMENSVDVITAAMKQICKQKVEPDGMKYDADSVAGNTIAEDATYEGIRIRIHASLGNARVSLQIDVGFGDAIIPAASEIKYPTILDLPAPRLKGYSRESTVAEKFHTTIRLGILNSRMKDFYDIWFLSNRFDFKGRRLTTAVRKTFESRNADIPSQPIVFHESFVKDKTKDIQWNAFVRKSKLNDAPSTFVEVVIAIGEFLTPIASAVANRKDFKKTWKAPGSWR